MWTYFEETGKAIDTDTARGLYILPSLENKYKVYLVPIFKALENDDTGELALLNQFDDEESAKAYIKDMVEKLNKEAKADVYNEGREKN